ncbi:MAG: copper homeostasis protein CutC [Candidatus Cryptobacteroides sp.]
MPNRRHILEICASSLQSVQAAVDGGAQRVELCSALDEGGVTPSLGFIREARKNKTLKIHVLIRPRRGDFLYNESEIACMEQDIVMAKSCGADGIVIGALTADGLIDKEVCKRLINAAGNMNITFHRAFDLCQNPYKALDDIIRLGFNRILTSGQAPTAIDGIPLIKELINRSGNTLTILPGGGVSPDNARYLLEETGATELHASARAVFKSNMHYRSHRICMGVHGADEYQRKETSCSKVMALLQAMNSAEQKLNKLENI